MGYSAQINKSNVVLPREVLPQILHIWKSINSPQFNHLKRGGSYSSGRQTSWYYSWMDRDYHETVNSVEEVLEMLGFYYSITEQGGILIEEYGDKCGQEDLFFTAIAHLIPNSKMVWVGEDASIWEWEFKDGVMLNYGRIQENPFLVELKYIDDMIAINKTKQTFLIA